MYPTIFAGVRRRPYAIRPYRLPGSKAAQEQGLHHTQSMMQPLVYNTPNEGRGYSGT